MNHLLRSAGLAAVLALGACQARVPTATTAEASPGVPPVATVDTDFSKGRLDRENPDTVGLADLVRFHGHLCDGLVVGHLALRTALQVLYPDQPVDRTNTRAVSQPSPCLTDAAVYLTGGRYQFNTFYVDPRIEGLFVVQRLDTQAAVAVGLRPGVKPAAIDQLGALAVAGTLSPCGLDSLRALEDAFTDFLLAHPSPDALFSLETLAEFDWQPVTKHDYPKSDVLNKSMPRCE